MTLAIYICAYLTVVHVDDEHQAVGEAIPDLNMRPTDDEHQADGGAIPDLNVQPTDIEQLPDEDVAFAVADEQDDFNLNLQASAQYEEMQESMITKPGCSSILFIIIMHNYFDLMRLHRGHT
jgi:hypothetical protein